MSTETRDVGIVIKATCPYADLVAVLERVKALGVADLEWELTWAENTDKVRKEKTA